MRHDEIDRTLASEGVIEPSSGFTAAVMEAVRREAETPVPIAFPWRRALPGIALAVVALGVLVVLAVAGGSQPSAAAGAAPPDGLRIPSQLLWAVGGLVGASLVAYFAVRLSVHGADASL